MSRRLILAASGLALLLVATIALAGGESARASAPAPELSILKVVDTSGGQPFFKSFATAGGSLWFLANGSTHGALWRSDGTTDGTVAFPSADGPFHETPVQVGDRLLFTNGNELFSSDLAGTDITPVGPSDGDSMAHPRNLTAEDGFSVFLADNAIGIPKVWRTDGTTGGTVNTNQTFRASEDPIPDNHEEEFAAMGGRTYFKCDTLLNGHLGQGLCWVTATGSGNVPGTENINPRYLTALGTVLYFSALDADGVRRLFVTDGTTTTQASSNMSDPGEASASGDYGLGLVAAGDTLYFPATDSNGITLWEARADGTVEAVQTDSGQDAPVEPGRFSDMAVVGDRVYFAAFDSVHGRELWSASGDTMELVADMTPGVNEPVDDDNHVVFGLTAFDNTLYFGLDSTLYRLEDGTPDAVTSINQFADPTVFGDALYYGNDDGVHGFQPWKLIVPPPPPPPPPAPDPGPTPSGGGASGPPPGQATVAPASSGSVAAAGGSATLHWDAGTFGSSATLVARPAVPTAGAATGFSTGGAVIEITATDANGNRITTLDKPLVIHFSAGATGTVPASSSDGTTWTPMPPLDGPSLPDGQRDGYYTEADGSVDVYTRHLTLFGLLTDTRAPAASTLGGRFVHGALVLRWTPAADNGRIARYELDLDGKPLATIDGTATTAATRAFHPAGRSTYTLVAVDAAGNRGAASNAVAVTPRAVPAGVPARVPTWAYALQAWLAEPAATRGQRPASTPTRAPRWFPAWAAWHAAPFQLAR
jgi:ELWxxDGT repeat protein